jgi:N-acetylmuramoyl-L-alanine amidase
MQGTWLKLCASAVAIALGLITEVAADPAAADAKKSEQTRTRFVIGIEKPVLFTISTLSNPNRVIVELPDVKVALPNSDGGKPVGLVQSFRGGQAADNRMKVVIDVTEPVVVTASGIEKSPDGKGHRLAIEIASADDVATTKTKSAKKLAAPSGLGASSVQPPLPVPAVSPKKKADRSYKPVIVIDPGHGGHDSGATKHGAVEKNVVLAFGLVLRDKLVKTGNYKVLMTRDTDTFVELDDRVAFAERNNAALFIAVHADYANSNARGATIFSLRTGEYDDLKGSAKGALVKNALSSPRTQAIKKVGGEQEVNAVKSILDDLAKQEVAATQDRSKLFAGTVIEKMGDATEMRSTPDKQAAFRVLQTAQFPSVLIELAYVTNRKDAENLKSEEWRSGVADSIVTAVGNYFNHKLAHLPM